MPRSILRLSLVVWMFNVGILLHQIKTVHASPPFVLPDDTPQRKPNFNARISSSVKDVHRDATGVSSGTILGSTSSTGNTSSSTTTTTSATSRSIGAKEMNSNTNNNRLTSSKRPIRVAFQGEPGAYSEKALRELLGPNVIAVPRPDFESCYRAVASGEVEYACLPFENSLGGSIHDNYDLILRYDLQIVAEHDCRVRHCLHVVDGVKKEDIKYCMSHPQALAQCDNYLRSLGIKPIPMYDTAGSAKLLKENSLTKDGVTPERQLPDKCNPGNTAAIASDLAGETYGLTCLEKGIEDDDSNFTRFLLLGRSGVSQYLNKNIPSKTSIVFTLPNTPGALYKALACFSLREIDFSKIESRPTSASLLNYLRFKSQQRGNKSRSQADLPRFRYCFYLDFLANDLDDQAQNALHHLREQAEFCKILGSYPQKSKLVGPVHDEVEDSKLFKVESRDDVVMKKLPSDDGGLKLNIGIIGFGAFGQFLGRKFAEDHKVRCLDSNDKVSNIRLVV
jgi:prephenate dehydratase